MTNEEIEEMAELSGLYLYKTNEEFIYCLTYFAKLVAEKEREACAKLCDQNICEAKNFFDKGVNSASIKLAKVIRARIEK